jgi:acetyl esterase/lipase
MQRLLILIAIAHLCVAFLEYPPNNCIVASNTTWENPGGVSLGARFCIKKFVELEKAGKNAYMLIDSNDKVKSLVHRQPVENVSIAWNATVDKAAANRRTLWYSESNFPYSDYKGQLDTAEWIVPVGYRQREGEARLLFIHGSDSRDSALGRDYAGLTARLANWTQMPVFSFNYPTEPIAPWPANIRNVFYYMSYALDHGHEGRGRASKLILVGDSEGTLVILQTVLAAMNPTLRVTFGYGRAFQDVNSWLGGVILSSPVIDVACETPSFEWNCYDEAHDTGDPDTGNCTLVPTPFARRADCLWSYLTYHFGFPGLQMGNVNDSTTVAEWEYRRDFFEQGFINPLRADFKGFPPMLLLAGLRDYYYSDAPRLANLACQAGVDVEVFNVVGVYHDFIEYSDGCGGPSPMDEALEAYRRIQAFIASKTQAFVSHSESIGRVVYL